LYDTSPFIQLSRVYHTAHANAHLLPSHQNKASDPPKYKGDKDFQPASMRVKDAAEAVLTCIIDQVVRTLAL